MSDLVAFLRARLDAEQEEAERIGSQRGMVWSATREGISSDRARLLEGAYGSCNVGSLSTFVARHDPTRVLAEVAAKRAILDEHGEAPISRGQCGMCMQELPCRTVRLLVQPYAAHPHFHPSWSTS